MTSSARRASPANVSDLLQIPEEERFHEILSGELVEKASPSAEHGDAQSWLSALLKPSFARPSGSEPPGGWWIMTEVEVELEPTEVVRPDLVGWRRERVPERPSGSPVRARPDWLCEILSAGSARTDTVRKMRLYHRAQIPHYWIVDPSRETLTVYRHTSEGYLVALVATRGERARLEPFAAIELPIGLLFGDDTA